MKFVNEEKKEDYQEFGVFCLFKGKVIVVDLFLVVMEWKWLRSIKFGILFV